jgi:hypothetical protein
MQPTSRLAEQLLPGTLSGILSAGAQASITSIGQLSNLSVSGVIEGGTFSGTLSSTAQNTITQLR